MKLWHCRESRSLRALWALEELNFEYELRSLPFPPRIRQPAYLAVNPLGTVPFFQDGEVSMTESVAICHYLVERYARYEFGLRSTEPEYGAYLNWLYHSDATLTFPLTLALRYGILEPQRAPVVAEDYRRWFFSRLRLLDASLENREYLCGGRFTIADITITYALYLARYLQLSDRLSPHVRDYLGRMTQRPAFLRANAMG